MAGWTNFSTNIVSLREAHPVVFAMLVTPVATAVLNTLFFFFASDRWWAFLARNPRVGALLGMLRAVGVNPPGIAKWAYRFLTGRLYVDITRSFPPDPPLDGGGKALPAADSSTVVTPIQKPRS